MPKKTASAEAIYTSDELRREWHIEYQRLGNQYARIAALFIIFTYPLGVLADVQFIQPNLLYIYLLIQFFPSVIIPIALLIRRFYPYRHEYLVLVMAFCLFASATHRVEGQDLVYYLINNGICFTASAVLMIVNFRYPIIIFGYVVLINVIVTHYIYQEDLGVYFRRDGGIVVMVLGAVFVAVANFRYQILRTNFINSLALKQSYQLLEIKSQQLAEQANIIKEKNDDITSSINYAERIQKAILPPIEQMQEVFKEYFILFMPRDIVSGDFYWFDKIENKTILTAVDCTGHGVPGAFMSMIGNDLLNQIVSEREITEADRILEEVQIGIRKALRHESKINDGMDIALVVIDHTRRVMEYAGAKNPLIYIQNQVLHLIKGEHFSIGGKTFEMEYKFEKHSIDISSPTTFYLFSDGFQDQFGGDKGKKFMTPKFRDLLLQIHQRPTAEQQAILRQTLQDWMGTKNRQVDDVLVIGVKL